jgi:23S rRNA (cytidine1920-2'-O)/16S rRNA (cytidine1409-2'-O)-methyltransferase
VSPEKIRADDLVVELGLAEDEKHAAALLMSGTVIATDPSGHEHKIEKAGERMPIGTTLRITGGLEPFVSRAGRKLDAALTTFQIDVRDHVCADIGVSTGGFTDCLLRRGAARVHCVDVAYGQVAWRVRSDPRVSLHERTNARHLPKNAFGESVDIVVADVSFISLTAILPVLVEQNSDAAHLVLMVKPQFEVDREHAPGGVVVDPQVRLGAIDRVIKSGRKLGLRFLSGVPSSVPGRDGNVEHFIHFEALGGE